MKIVIFLLLLISVGCSPCYDKQVRQGERAYRLGLSPESNPYRNGWTCDAASWLDGYMDAKQNDRR